MIVLKVRVHDPSIAVVDFGGFLQRHPDAPNHPADLLAV
jgi:hypothetical protein